MKLTDQIGLVETRCTANLGTAVLSLFFIKILCFSTAEIPTSLSVWAFVTLQALKAFVTLQFDLE